VSKYGEQTKQRSDQDDDTFAVEVAAGFNRIFKFQFLGFPPDKEQFSSLPPPSHHGQEKLDCLAFLQTKNSPRRYSPSET